MRPEAFRPEMIEKIRAFDIWLYKDAMTNPAAYEGYTFQEYFELFQEWLQND